MAIEDNIREIQTEILEDTTGKKGDTIRNQAVAAIYSGMGSPEWVDYMQNYAKTPEELARLTTRSGDGAHPYIPLARAYLIANATCLPGTTGLLLQGIEGFIDKTL